MVINAGELVVGLKDGNVNSYRIDQHEPQKSADFWTFAEDRWDMFFGKKTPHYFNKVMY